MDLDAPAGVAVDIGDGLHVFLHDLGPTDGDVVVFLHGSGPGASGWSNFRGNGPFLAEHGFRVLLVDSLGYGQSSKPDTKYTLDFMSGGVVRALDALGVGSFTLVGNSQGGAQAIRIALEHPDRVDRLVLMAPGGLEKREVYMEMRGIRSMLRCIYGPEGITVEGMRKVFGKQLYDASMVTEQIVQERYDVAMQQPRYVFETMRVDNQEDRLGDLHMPILGLWGQDDLFCPVSGAVKLAERCPNARITTFTKCGHWVMVEHRDVFNRLVLDFLQHG